MDIRYFKIDLGSDYVWAEGADEDYFECQNQGTISKTFCRNMYQKAKKLKPKDISRWQACVGCQIGAFHSDEKPVHIRSKSNVNSCVRCHAYANRLLSNGVCISCSNRASEVRKGRNGKGRTPNPYETFWGYPEKMLGKGKTVQLHDISVTSVDSNGIKISHVRQSSNLFEAMLRILRTTREEVVFARDMTCRNKLLKDIY